MIERATRIGDLVRCSPGSHITSSCLLADRVFLDAGVRTVNDHGQRQGDDLGATRTDANPTFPLPCSAREPASGPARSSWPGSPSASTP
ncbi:MAG TPA: hypothetical protein VHZ03_34930 [Trebonia sp.]|nr:hypothetical protein [Trebonia sp.]